ncbi:MAG: hypothetical protein J5I93_09585 [Pirellulaceae bacterium]|nr:hypothetical protein [Pirellulaceae bacterium]
MPAVDQSPANRSLRSARLRTRVTLALAIAILIPSMYGFAGKFYEFLHLVRGESDGAFAVAPILNYLLASGGFLLLLLWATANGMFHDIERPKHTLLDREQQLDAAQRRK